MNLNVVTVTSRYPNHHTTHAFGYGPHNASAARRRSTQNNCRSRFPGLSCTHKRSRIIHRSHVIIQSPQARKPQDRMRGHAEDGQTYLVRVDIACETLTVRKSSCNQASISHICYGLVPQSQAVTTTSQSEETHFKGIRPRVMHCHTYATQHPHATPPCMRALAPSYDRTTLMGERFA